VNSTAVNFVSHTRAVPPSELSGAAVAVIDLLRATTTLTAALAAGVAGIIPCVSVEAAVFQAEKLRKKNASVVLAGERGGLRIPGFDLGNSPLEFTRSVRRKTVVLATSNGTKALAAVAPARFVVAGCLNNLSAAAAALARRHERLFLIVAAGEEGGWSEEDGLAAGLLLRELVRLKRGALRPARDFDRAAKTAYTLAAGYTPRRIETFLRRTSHGQELAALGFAADLRACARLNTTRTVGWLSPGGIIKKL